MSPLNLANCTFFYFSTNCFDFHARFVALKACLLQAGRSDHLTPYKPGHKEATVSDAFTQSLNLGHRFSTIKVICHCTDDLYAQTYFDYLQSKLPASPNKDSKTRFKVFLALQQAEKGEQGPHRQRFALRAAGEALAARQGRSVFTVAPSASIWSLLPFVLADLTALYRIVFPPAFTSEIMCFFSGDL